MCTTCHQRTPRCEDFAEMGKKGAGGVRFLKSAFQRGHWPDESVPEVAFVGRSNVGKAPA